MNCNQMWRILHQSLPLAEQENVPRCYLVKTHSSQCAREAEYFVGQRRSRIPEPLHSSNAHNQQHDNNTDAWNAKTRIEIATKQLQLRLETGQMTNGVWCVDVARVKQFKRRTVNLSAPTPHFVAAILNITMINTIGSIKDVVNEIRESAWAYVSAIVPDPAYYSEDKGSKMCLKPGQCLLDMITTIVYNSPHAILHVTHIYAALQKRYPYYQQLDQKALLSWKSSVRHTLSHSWPFKIRFSSWATTSKGYYWGFNHACMLPTHVSSEHELRLARSSSAQSSPIRILSGVTDPSLASAASCSSTSDHNTSISAGNSIQTPQLSPCSDRIFDSPTVLQMIDHSPRIISSLTSTNCSMTHVSSGYETADFSQ